MTTTLYIASGPTYRPVFLTWAHGWTRQMKDAQAYRNEAEALAMCDVLVGLGLTLDTYIVVGEG